VFALINPGVVSASSIGAARGGGYARYLEAKTVAPERGDYYLTPDGELTQAPGRWLADPETLDRLGVDPVGPVAGGDFISLMEGRHPGTGRFLRPEGAGGGRGGGIDVTFSAPKSVSTVWALAEPWQRQEIEAAHSMAVEQTVGYMREHVPVVRRRFSGQIVEEPAKDLIAAEYQHTTARGVAGGRAPDPQLHSHVVIAGVVREDDRLVATWSRPVFRSARELGAHYRAALAHELAERGYEIAQATGKDGKYFELAGVPEGLREAFSGRSREVARAAERFRARTGREPKRGELRDLALENRRAKTLATRRDLEHVWRQAGSEHAFGPWEALQLLAGPERAKPERPLEDRVETRLVEHHAVFDAKDLRTVVLEQAAGEMSPEQALRVAKGMVRDRRVLTLEGGRMTTLAIRAQEQAIERRAQQLAAPGGRDVGERARTRAISEVAEQLAGPPTPEQTAALTAITGDERLAVLVGPAGTGNRAASVRSRTLRSTPSSRCSARSCSGPRTIATSSATRSSSANARSGFSRPRSQRGRSSRLTSCSRCSTQPVSSTNRPAATGASVVARHSRPSLSRASGSPSCAICAAPTSTSRVRASRSLTRRPRRGYARLR